MGEQTGADERPGIERDPDAPWRPGYEGWSSATSPPEPEHDAPARVAATAHPLPADERRNEGERDAGSEMVSESSPGWRRVVPVAVILAVVVVAVVAGIVGWARSSGDEASADGTAAPTIARSGDVAWTANVDPRPTTTADSEPAPFEGESSAAPGALPNVGADDGVLAFASPFGDEIRAHDIETGEVLWVESALVAGAGVAELAVLGDRVIAEQRRPSGEGVLTAFDSRTGDVVWNTDPAGAGARVRASAGEPALLQRRDDGDGFDLLDPADGAVVASAAGLSAVTTPDRSLVMASSSGRVTLWSPTELRFVTEPVSDFNLLDIAEIDEGTLGFDTDGRIVAFDDVGDRTDELRFVSEASGRSARRPALVGAVRDERFGIVASGSSVGLRVEGGAIRVAWEIEGRAEMPIATNLGVLSVVLGDERDVIIDALSGTGVLDLGPAAPGTREIVLGRDGYLTDTLSGPDGRVLEAFGYDGTSRWSRPITAASIVHVVDGAVVIVGDSDGVVVLR